MPPFLAWWMPAKKSVKLPIIAGRCKVQSAALCSSPRSERLDFGPVRAVCRQQRREAPAQCEARILAEGHQRVQTCSSRRFCSARCLSGEQPRL